MQYRDIKRKTTATATMTGTRKMRRRTTTSILNMRRIKH